MLVQALGGGALLEGELLTQLLEKALLPGQPHLGQGGDGAATEGQPPEGRAQQQGVALQDAPHRPSGRAGRGSGSGHDSWPLWARRRRTSRVNVPGPRGPGRRVKNVVPGVSVRASPDEINARFHQQPGRSRSASLTRVGLVQSVEGSRRSKGWPSGEGGRTLLLPDCLELELFHAFGRELRPWPFLGLEPTGSPAGAGASALLALGPSDLRPERGVGAPGSPSR